MSIGKTVNRLLFLILICSTFQAYGQDDKREELEQRRLELQQEIRRINNLRTSNLAKEKSILTEGQDDQAVLQK